MLLSRFLTDGNGNREANLTRRRWIGHRACNTGRVFESRRHSPIPGLLTNGNWLEDEMAAEL
jgi:hypothetical protein